MMTELVDTASQPIFEPTLSPAYCQNIDQSFQMKNEILGPGKTICWCYSTPCRSHRAIEDRKGIVRGVLVHGTKAWDPKLMPQQSAYKIIVQ